MPVAIDHLKVKLKHIVINLMIPQVTIQLNPYNNTITTITMMAAATLILLLLDDIFSLDYSYLYSFIGALLFSR